MVLQSCNEITSERPVLIDENSSKMKISKKYWAMQNEKGESGEFGFVVDTPDKKKKWSIAMAPNPENELPFELRAKKIKSKRYIFQIAFQEKDREEYSLFVAERKDRNQYLVYTYSKSAIQKAENHPSLSSLKEHFSITGSSLKFDAYMADNHKENIIKFIMSLDPKTDFRLDDSLILKGTNDEDLFKSLLKKIEK